MKIVYLIHQFYPQVYTGTEKFTLSVSSMMQRAGNKVKVISYSLYDDAFYDQVKGPILLKEFTYQGIPVLALKHKRIPHDLDYALWDRDIADIGGDLIQREKPDIAHIAHCMRISTLAEVLQLRRVPYVMTLTDYFLACPKVNLTTSQGTLCKGPEEGEACRKLCPELPFDYITNRLRNAKKLLFNAQLVVAPSRFLAGVFSQEFPGLEVKVINHGLNFSKMQRHEKSYDNDDPITFCYAGSFNHHKGLHILIQAFKRIRSKNALLRIYGSGPDQSYVDSVKAMAEGDQRIEFCGVYSAEKTGEILSAVDVVVVPSLCYENYPTTLHEALACNVPVVAADIGGMAEKITEGVNGFLYRMGDVQHLHTVLQKIVDEPAVLNPLKRNIDKMMIPCVEEEAYTYGRAYQAIVDGQSLRKVGNTRLQ